MARPDCVICRGPDGDAQLDRVEVWRDDRWRLSMSRHGATLGFSYLEPIRHIPYLAELDGPEADEFGPTIARACRVVREATGARTVYVYVFGDGVPHLHVHLAPNRPEGVLSSALVAGATEQRPLPGGATEIVSLDHPDLPAAELAEVIDRVRDMMAVAS